VDKNKPFVLLDAADHGYTAQAGLTGGSCQVTGTSFSAEAESYRLEEDKDQLEVRLRAPDRGGVP
jgi:hypothetical protein